MTAATDPATRWLPDEAPLAMPEQDLHHGTLVTPRMPTSPRGIGLRRIFVFSATIALTVVATLQVAWVLKRGGVFVLEGVMLALFVPLFAWIALSFVSALAGFVVLMTRRADVLVPPGEAPPLRTRTALLLPTYNEDPRRVFASVQAMHESLRATGQATQFDFFVLSDTRRDAVAVQEEAAFLALRTALPDGAGLYYRRREKNTARKAGNIADWVRRFGAAYPQMLILDADSLMAGDTLVRLAATMEKHADIGLLQTLPVVVNGRTLFARMQQFAGRVYGPVLAHGLAWWHGAAGNYWGHNAIIRTAAFAAHAGLPELRGSPPFSGTVLSHDFVEAALLRRAGWAVHLVPQLGGSFEEGPPSLTDTLVRDRRWCQGNLQHGGVIGAAGLHPLSRVHLAMGMLQYFTAPMWATLMLVAMAIPLQPRGLMLMPPRDGGTTDPWLNWKVSDPERYLWVFAVTMGMLLLPKLMGLVATLRDPATRRACGGTLRLFAGVVVEMVLTTLMAPVTMVVQSRGVAEVLAGKDSGWETQRRDDGSVPLASLVRSYAGLSLFGALAGAVAWHVSPALALWMSPVILGMVLAVPVNLATGSVAVGDALRRLRLLATPDETAPSPLLQRAAALREAGPPGPR